MRRDHRRLIGTPSRRPSPGQRGPGPPARSPSRHVHPCRSTCLRKTRNGRPSKPYGFSAKFILLERITLTMTGLGRKSERRCAPRSRSPLPPRFWPEPRGTRQAGKTRNSSRRRKIGSKAETGEKLIRRERAAPSASDHTASAQRAQLELAAIAANEFGSSPAEIWREE